MRALVWIALGSLVSAPALAGTWTNLWRTPDQQGQALLAAGQAAQAAQRFTNPRLKAYADLKAGRYADAAQLLAPFKDATSEYNRGNALARSGQLQAALAAYDAALKQDPRDRDIRHNRDLVAKLLQQHPPQSARNPPGGKQSTSGQPSGSKPSAPGGKQSASGQTPDQKQSANGNRNGKGSQGTGKSGASSNGTNRSNGARNGQSGSQGNGSPSGQGGVSRAGQPESKAQGPNGGQAQPAPQPTAGAGPSKHSPGQARRDAAWAAAMARHEGQAGRQTPAGAGRTANGSLRQGQAGQDFGVSGGTATPRPKPVSEKTLALDQWLRQIPDNPAGLLRRKFLIEYMMRHPGETPPGGNP